MRGFWFSRLFSRLFSNGERASDFRGREVEGIAVVVGLVALVFVRHCIVGESPH